MMYVHRHLPLEGCWTVGFYSPDGEWEPVSDHDTEQAAAAEVVRLNGGHAPSGDPVTIADLLAAVEGFMACRASDGTKCAPNDSDFDRGAKALAKSRGKS